MTNDLRSSTRTNPISQAELTEFLNAHPELVLEVQKISIPVQLTKTAGGEVVHTVIVKPNGRVVFETVNTATPGGGIDHRPTPDGRTERYCKSAENVTEQYYIVEGNRKFSELKPGETVNAHTVGREIRTAMIAMQDIYLETTWGNVQLVAKGGLITFTETGEAIGNNNPCDIVILENG